MSLDSREQACWLALVFESRLTIRIVNNILVVLESEVRETRQNVDSALSTTESMLSINSINSMGE
jgi:hypothetical protein